VSSGGIPTRPEGHAEHGEERDERKLGVAREPNRAGDIGGTWSWPVSEEGPALVAGAVAQRATELEAERGGERGFGDARVW
jgi:hypothetical protein